MLKLAPALQQLAHRTSQLGAMHWLEYFLKTRSFASKPPYLVLQLGRYPIAEPLHSDNILAAALFFEYRLLGLRTRIFSTDDAVGYRTVVAAAHERELFAHRVVRALLKSGAHIVLANYQSTGEVPIPLPLQHDVLSGRRERPVPRMLHLRPTYEETLAQFGHSTRFNLRYYRRRLTRRTRLEFLDEAWKHITPAEFASLNAASLNPIVSAHEVNLRWSCSRQLPGSFVVGLRSSEGKWLSLIGGWRQDTTTVLHWQLNTAGFEHDSIGTVMRSFFLEHEIARGTRELLIFGGTPHTIRHAFHQDAIVDLVLCRDSLRSRICRALARYLSGTNPFPGSNHLLRTLGELDLQPMTSSESFQPSLTDFEQDSSLRDHVSSPTPL